MADVSLHQPHSQIISMAARTLLWVAIIGAIVGALFWGGTLLIDRVALEPVFCGSAENQDICNSKRTIAEGVAIVLAVFIGIIGLIRANVYRPLLISIAVAASLWGVGSLFVGMPWYFAMLWAAGLFLFAYLLFVWISRIRNFPIALALTILVIVGVRYLASL